MVYACPPERAVHHWQWQLQPVLAQTNLDEVHNCPYCAGNCLYHTWYYAYQNHCLFFWDIPFPWQPPGPQMAVFVHHNGKPSVLVSA